jgi:antitoxin (DNA-binding transcriptional repressor) of toxin-antitoxin stability system
MHRSVGELMANIQTFNATEFKAKCLEILDRLGAHEVDQVVVTKRGKAVAVLTPPPSEDAAVRGIHGFMRGSAVVAPDFDLTEPVNTEPFVAEAGDLNG